jgi:hypothetical protein
MASRKDKKFSIYSSSGGAGASGVSSRSGLKPSNFILSLTAPSLTPLDKKNLRIFVSSFF